MTNREKYSYIVLSIAALLLFSLMNYIQGEAFDFDEVFSLAMIEHSFSEMWAITARDVHPPLSYFILKVISWGIDPFTTSSLEPYKLSSILGFFTTILLCIFPIRRLWGYKVSVIAILLLMLMPMSFYIYSNIRMYAWTTPLVLASFIYAYDAFTSNKNSAWIKFTLVASCTMYMHYYALISTFVTCVLLFFFIVSKGQQERKELLKKYLVSGVVLIVLYIPWLYFLMGQLAAVKADYWIEYPAISDIAFAIQYYFVPKYYTEKYINLLSNKWIILIVPILLFVTISIILLAYTKFKDKSKEFRLPIYSSAVALAIILISLAMVMIYTYTVKPVYHIRYLMCYFGLFVLGLAICIDVLLKNKTLLSKGIIGVFALLLLIDFGLCVSFNIKRSNFTLSERKSNNIDNKEIKEYYSVEDSFYEMAYLSVLHPNNKYYLVTDDNPATRKINAPCVENDTISGSPFSNFSKMKTLDVDHQFLYMSKENPANDTTFTARYQIIDSVYSHLYVVIPRLEVKQDTITVE